MRGLWTLLASVACRSKVRTRARRRMKASSVCGGVMGTGGWCPRAQDSPVEGEIAAVRTEGAKEAPRAHSADTSGHMLEAEQRHCGDEQHERWASRVTSAGRSARSPRALQRGSRHCFQPRSWRQRWYLQRVTQKGTWALGPQHRMRSTAEHTCKHIHNARTHT